MLKDWQELLVGIEVEHEHTKCKILARKIASAHLKQNSHYYTDLYNAKIIDEMSAIRLIKKFFKQNKVEETAVKLTEQLESLSGKKVIMEKYSPEAQNILTTYENSFSNLLNEFRTKVIKEDDVDKIDVTREYIDFIEKQSERLFKEVSKQFEFI